MTAKLTEVLSRIHQLATEKKVQFTLKAIEELADLDVGLDVECMVVSFHEDEPPDEEDS